MAVALVDSTVGGQEVHVLAPLGVPDIDTLSLGEDNREGVVVVSSVLILGSNGSLGGSGVEAAVEASGDVSSVGSHGEVVQVVIVKFRSGGVYVSKKTTQI